MYNNHRNANETAAGKQCAIISIFIEQAAARRGATWRDVARGADAVGVTKTPLAVFGLFRALFGGH